MKKKLLLFIFCLSIVQAFSQMSWQSRATFPGPSRHHAIGFSHGSKGYVMTGEDSAQYKDVWEYDTLTNAWIQLADYPGLERSYGIGAVVNDTAYMGFGYNDTTYLTDWWGYNFTTATWSQKTDFPGEGRNHPTSAAINGKVYVGFGDNVTSGSINDWWEYDPATDMWTQKTNYPGLRMHHPVTTTANNLIYLSEGHIIDTLTNYGSNDVYSYDGLTDTWTPLADMPGPGVVAGASFYLGNGVIYSGAGITEPVETFHHEFYTYDLATNVWDTIADYPGDGVFGPVSFSIGNVGYVATGFGNSHTTQDFIALAPMLVNDAGVISIATINNGPSCNTTFTPEITLKNFGSANLTTCTVNYQFDADPIQTYTWSGSLVTGDIAQISLPSQTVLPGTHTLTCYQSMPNGMTDINSINDQQTQQFLIFSNTVVPTPIFEGFDSSVFIPVNWQSYNPDGAITWAVIGGTGGFGISWSSLWMDCFDYSAAGESDYLYSPPMDFANLLSPAYLTFSIAYAPYDTVDYCEALDLDVSIDCGLNWINVYSKSCSDLLTDSATTDPFIPDSSNWRTDSINLDSYIGTAGLIVRFKSTNHYGNNLYLDDINFHTTPSAVNEIKGNSEMGVYPNPATNVLSFVNTLKNVEVYNMFGQSVTGKIVEANSISTEKLADGIYLLRSDAGTIKFVVKH